MVQGPQPCREVREGRTFSLDKLATALEQVIAGTAPHGFPYGIRAENSHRLAMVSATRRSRRRPAGTTGRLRHPVARVVPGAIVFGLPKLIFPAQACDLHGLGIPGRWGRRSRIRVLAWRSGVYILRPSRRPPTSSGLPRAESRLASHAPDSAGAAQPGDPIRHRSPRPSPRAVVRGFPVAPDAHARAVNAPRTAKLEAAAVMPNVPPVARPAPGPRAAARATDTAERPGKKVAA